MAWLYCNDTVLHGSCHLSYWIQHGSNWWPPLSTASQFSSWNLLHIFCPCTLDNCCFWTFCWQSLLASFVNWPLKNTQTQKGFWTLYKEKRNVLAPTVNLVKFFWNLSAISQNWLWKRALFILFILKSPKTKKILKIRQFQIHLS